MIGLDADERLKDAIQSILTSTKKRPASDTSDDEVIPIAATSPVVVRRPVKRLPTSKPDFHTFAPPNRRFTAEEYRFDSPVFSRPIETVGERTKSLLHNLGPRRARGESVAMTQIIAEEQLRLREKLMRKPKATPTDEKGLNCDFLPRTCSMCALCSAREIRCRTGETQSQWNRAFHIEESSNGRVVQCVRKLHLNTSISGPKECLW